MLLRFLPDSARDRLLTISNKDFAGGFSAWKELEFVRAAVGGHLYKNKGAVECLDNYRLIVVVSVPVKIVAGILARRLSAASEHQGVLGEWQAGFRPGRQTVETILIVRLLGDDLRCSQYTHQLDEIVLTLLDLRKAYPRQNWEVATATFKALGLDFSMSRFGRALNFLNRDADYFVKNSKGISEAFKLDHGWQEGGRASPTGFAVSYETTVRLFLEQLVKEYPDGTGVSLCNSSPFGLCGDDLDPRALYHPSAIGSSKSLLELLLFADDTTLLNVWRRVARVLGIYRGTCSKHDVVLNDNKTEALTPEDPEFT